MAYHDTIISHTDHGPDNLTHGNGGAITSRMVQHTRTKVGHPAPHFTMPTTADRAALESSVSLADYRGV